MTGDVADAFWGVLLDWVSAWSYRPEDFAKLGKLVVPKKLAESFREMASKYTSGARLAEKISTLVPERGFAKLNLTIPPGERLIIAILHPESEKLEARILDGAARIVKVVEGNRSTIIVVEGSGDICLGLSADADSVAVRAYIEVYEEAASTTTTITTPATRTVTKTTTITTTVPTTVVSTTTKTEYRTVTTAITKTVTSTVTRQTAVTVTSPATVAKTIEKRYTTTVTVVTTTTVLMEKTYTTTMPGGTATVTITVYKPTTTTVITTTTVERAGGAPYAIAAALLLVGLAIGFMLGRTR